MESEVTKDLVLAYFARKISPLQRELIAGWLREKANEEQYYEWLEEWESRHPQYLAQSAPAYQRFAAFLEQNPHVGQWEEPTVEQAGQKSRNWSRWLVAASVLLMLSGLSAAVFRNQILFQTYKTAYGESSSLQLSDGSRVLLNANSCLRVPRWGFGNRTREVVLTGEAFFSVAHTPIHQRFIVKTSRNVDVVVLGTEFTVSARRRGARVVLNKGKVELHYREGSTPKQLTMKPGELATFDRQNHVVLNTARHASMPPAQAGQDADKRFVFNETPLQEAAFMLEDYYGLHVEIRDKKLAARVLMGSMRAENVDQLLQSISELLDVDVVRQGNRVQLKSR